MFGETKRHLKVFVFCELRLELPLSWQRGLYGLWWKLSAPVRCRVRRVSCCQWASAYRKQNRHFICSQIFGLLLLETRMSKPLSGLRKGSVSCFSGCAVLAEMLLLCGPFCSQLLQGHVQLGRSTFCSLHVVCWGRSLWRAPGEGYSDFRDALFVEIKHCYLLVTLKNP